MYQKTLELCKIVKEVFEVVRSMEGEIFEVQFSLKPIPVEYSVGNRYRFSEEGPQKVMGGGMWQPLYFHPI